MTGVETTDELRALRTWLAEEPELRGHVHLVERPPEAGQLGTVPVLILVTLGTGATTAGLMTAVSTWLQHRAVDVACTVAKTVGGAGVTLSARDLRQADLAARGRLTRELATTLAADAGAPRGEG
ncbi:effector-associated constant component EACC1 [Saccharopolyspora gloriosae]|uniref:effector-associated constant component EACC1 n=1 Tax=Saccharopolyspora gloriosae TaxID=455344 RepID=UPI001FB6523B|nr:hypothetical protein [Saccharopolyspora gloriosae]